MRFLHLLFLLTCCSLLQAQPCREVVAFYPSWKWYDRGRLVNPFTIDYSKYTFINYAFLTPERDGSISLFDPFADKTILLGEIKNGTKKGYKKSQSIDKDFHVAGTSLVDQAHANGLKVLISIGGWTLSDHFSIIASSPEKRSRFAKSCGELVHTYHVDGVDIDWEYPGFKSKNANNNDAENFTLLLKEIHRVFDILQKESGKKIWLTADFGAGASHMAHIEWEKVAPLLDHINIMTYSYYGSRPSRTNHHSPLYAPRKGVAGYDINSSIRHLIENHQVPASKINIGLAFFGRSLRTKGKADIHKASQRTKDEKTFSKDKGTPPYYSIVAQRHKFHYHWDEMAEVPYLNGKKIKTFVTYDDEKSIYQKGRYIVENELGGAIIWDIVGDYFENKKQSGVIEKTPLADALKEALCFQEEEMIVYEKPVREKILIQTISQQWTPLTRRSFAPRLAYQPPDISKKEKKRNKKRKKKKKKNAVPQRYFDGGW